jgi:asparagine synthase (glutamine-hydrolysing)
MCGFAGYLAAADQSADTLTYGVRQMIEPLVHRGPDASGTWVDEHAGFALGFRRLAIIDVSPAGHQPMRSATGRYVLAFNGEVYNFEDLRAELEPLGAVFRGRSDTEVILAAFEAWGIVESVKRFVGMFALAVWDTDRRQLTLVRDRLGKKPLYIYREPGLVTFGSELKALFAGPSFDRTIDQAALASYLRYLYVPAPRTIFTHAKKLPQGHLLQLVDPGQPLPATKPYWSLRQAALDGLSDPLGGTEADRLDALDALLQDAVRCRLRSDVPLGALLSGGVDSSTVVALMQEAAGRPVKTYTIGFADEAFDEAKHAAGVARHLGTDHTELCLTGTDTYSLVQRLPAIFDEPFADPSQLPTLLVSQLARQEVTVALSGDGGDELFGGYNRYVFGSEVLPRLNRVPGVLRRPVGAGIERVPVAAWDRLHAFTSQMVSRVARVPIPRFGERLHKLGQVMHASSVGGMYRSLLSAGWQRPEEVASARNQPLDDPPEQLLDAEAPGQLLDRMMLVDQMVYLPDDLLAKLDRTSMAVSLEVRAPLLDHRVVELSWRLPRSLKLRGQVGKWALRQVLYRRVPRSLIDRPKMGFSVPIDRWLRGPLRSWAEGLIADAMRERDEWLNPVAVTRGWKRLLDGEPSAGLGIWSVVMLQAWRATWRI